MLCSSAIDKGYLVPPVAVALHPAACSTALCSLQFCEKRFPQGGYDAVSNCEGGLVKHCGVASCISPAKDPIPHLKRKRMEAIKLSNIVFFASWYHNEIGYGKGKEAGEGALRQGGSATKCPDFGTYGPIFQGRHLSY